MRTHARGRPACCTIWLAAIVEPEQHRVKDSAGSPVDVPADLPELEATVSPRDVGRLPLASNLSQITMNC
jgi:hypothetical protein